MGGVGSGAVGVEESGTTGGDGVVAAWFRQRDTGMRGVGRAARRRREAGQHRAASAASSSRSRSNRGRGGDIFGGVWGCRWVDRWSGDGVMEREWGGWAGRLGRLGWCPAG